MFKIKFVDLGGGSERKKIKENMAEILPPPLKNLKNRYCKMRKYDRISDQ